MKKKNILSKKFTQLCYVSEANMILQKLINKFLFSFKKHMFELTKLRLYIRDDAVIY